MTNILKDTLKSKIFKITMVIVFIISISIALFFTYVKIEMNGDGEFCAYEIYDNGNQRNIISGEANWKSGGQPCILLLKPVISNLLSVLFIVFGLFSVISLSSIIILCIIYNKFIKGK